MKQTSIEWLIEQLQAPCRGIPSHIIEQAKQMHKQEIEDAYNKCYEDLSNTQKEVDKLSTYASQLPQQETVTNCNHLEISDEEIEQWSRIKSVGKGYDGSRFQNTYEEGFIDAIKWYREQLKQRQ